MVEQLRIYKWFHHNKKDLLLINSLVIPLLLTQILQLLFQLGDQAIVGRLGIHEFAAVGLVASFIYLITGTIGILSTAFNIVGGRYLGQNDVASFGRTFNTSITLSILIGLLSEALILIFGEWILKTVYGLEPSILGPASQYLYISGISIGMNMILFNFSAYFKNIRKTRILVLSFISASVVNVALDYTLVYGKFGFPELGVSGAAVGSVAGLAVGIGISIVAFRKDKSFRYSFHMDKKIFHKLFKLYVPLALQDLVEYTLFAIGLSVIVASLDVKLLAGYNVVTTLIEFTMIPMYVFSASCMTLTAQEYGKQNQGYSKYAKLSLVLLMIVCVPLSLLVIFFSFPLTKLITDKEAIVAVVQQIIPWAIMFNLMNGLQMIMKSSLQAVELERWVLVFSTCVYAVSIVIIYLLAGEFELLGVYSGLGLSYLMSSLGYIFKLKKKGET